MSMQPFEPRGEPDCPPNGQGPPANATGLTLAQGARRLGMSQAVLTRWVRSGRISTDNPEEAQLIRIEDLDAVSVPRTGPDGAVAEN